MKEQGPVRIPRDVLEELEAVRLYTRTDALDIPLLRYVAMEREKPALVVWIERARVGVRARPARRLRGGRLTAEGKSERPQHEVPYLHVRAPRRVVGVGGEGDRPVARLYANRAGLLELREQIERALVAEEGTAAEGRYRETDEAEYDLWVMRATSREQMGEPREPERPDRSMFA